MVLEDLSLKVFFFFYVLIQPGEIARERLRTIPFPCVDRFICKESNKNLNIIYFSEKKWLKCDIQMKVRTRKNTDNFLFSLDIKQKYLDHVNHFIASIEMNKKMSPKYSKQAWCD